MNISEVIPVPSQKKKDVGDTQALIATAVKSILEALGEDPNREGLRDTPTRVAKMYQEVFSGSQATHSTMAN